MSFSRWARISRDPTGRTIGYVSRAGRHRRTERYLHDPIHLRGDELILPNLAGGSALHFATEPVADQVNQMAAAKAAKCLEWGKRVNELFGNRPA